MRDLRKYSRNTNVHLIIGFIFLLFLVGDGLIYLFYGRGAAISGLICIFGGFVPILMIIGLFAVMDFVIKKANEED